jgi:hypothetical protein
MAAGGVDGVPTRSLLDRPFAAFAAGFCLLMLRPVPGTMSHLSKILILQYEILGFESLAVA